MSLCVREQGARRVQSLRSVGAVGEGELEWWDPIATNQPDLTAAETGPRLRGIIDDDGLRPLFETRIHRTFRKIRPDSTTEITATLGQRQLHAVAGAATEPVCELELELTSGNPTALYDLALRLLDAAPLRIETRSLPERGYRLSGVEVTPIAPKPLTLEPSMSVEAVLQGVTRECIEHLLQNEPLAISGDATSFHQMRVALRRLRSVLSAIKSMLPAEQHRWLQAEFKWLAGNLGPVRDWDVFAVDLLAPVQSAIPEEGTLKQLAEAAGKRRQENYNLAKEAIGSRRYVELLLKVTCWYVSRGWRNQPVSERSAPLFAPVSNVAAPLLERRWRRVRKRSKGFAKRSQAERHQIRIAVKKLRYLTEFLGDLCDLDKVDASMKQLKLLQEELGHLNDVRTAQRLIEDVLHLSDKDAIRVSRQAGLVIGWHLHAQKNLESRLRRDVRRFRNAKPFWAGIQPVLAPLVLTDATPSELVDIEGSMSASS